MTGLKININEFLKCISENYEWDMNGIPFPNKYKQHPKTWQGAKGMKYVSGSEWNINECISGTIFWWFW